MDKLQPDSIVLDPTKVGAIRQDPTHIVKERRQKQREATKAILAKQRGKNESKTKMKGKNKPTKRHRKKQMNVIRERKEELAAAAAEGGKATGKGGREGRDAENKRAGVPEALHRFIT